MHKIFITILNNNNNNNNNNNDNNKGMCMSTEVAVPGDITVIKKEAEKILKYREFIIEIQRMWDVKARVITVITGATGTVSKSLRQYLRNIPGKQEIKELQTIAILGTAHTLREVLM
jgi:hypothetical protein